MGHKIFLAGPFFSNIRLNEFCHDICSLKHPVSWFHYNKNLIKPNLKTVSPFCVFWPFSTSSPIDHCRYNSLYCLYFISCFPICVCRPCQSKGLDLFLRACVIRRNIWLVFCITLTNEIQCVRLHWKVQDCIGKYKNS